MFKQPNNKLAPAEVKEQLHHLPRGWTSSLPGNARHKALANGWHLGAARLFFVLGIFAAMPPTARAKELNPLGGTAIDAMARLWESKPLLNGPGVPVFDDAMDLSAILEPEEHWVASRSVLRPNQACPQLEAGLQQWLPLWLRWRRRRPKMRRAVADEVAQLVDDLDDSVQQWCFSLEPHVQKAYFAPVNACSPVIQRLAILASMFGWQGLGLFDELTQGFPLLGRLRQGWGGDFARTPATASHFLLPTSCVRSENLYFVRRKLERQRADPAWEVMAAEIASDVHSEGAWKGPFEAPRCWGKSTVALAEYQRTKELLPGPCQHVPCCFAFAVRQVWSDGQPKRGLEKILGQLYSWC